MELQQQKNKLFLSYDSSEHIQTSPFISLTAKINHLVL